MNLNFSKKEIEFDYKLMLKTKNGSSINLLSIIKEAPKKMKLENKFKYKF